jgi:hypothetical protein
MLRFFLPIGIILIVMGILMLSMTPKSYGETTGIITDAAEYIDTDSEGRSDTYYEAVFTYTVDGVQYENSFSGYAEKPEIGKEIPVFYDPDNPESVSNSKSTGVISVIMIALGVAAAAFGVLSTVRRVRKNRELDEKLKSASGTGEMPVVTPIPKERLTEYYVSFDGNSLKPGYIVEDRSRNVIFTAPMTKNSLVGNRIFTFTDRRLGRTSTHEVGHTVTQSFSNEFFSTDSYFKFDGVNIWDVLHDRGIRIATDLRSKFPKAVYTVSLNGRFFATVETSSRYVHEEDEAEHSVKIPVGRYYFRCWTEEDNIELLFLTVFAISETEQAVVD